MFMAAAVNYWRRRGPMARTKYGPGGRTTLPAGLPDEAGGEEGFHGGGQWGAEFFKQGAGIGFGKIQGTGGGVNEPAGGLMGVTKKSLAQRQRIDRQRHTIDERVPALGLALVHGGEVALHDALIAQRA